jgi:hypothetical protein
LWLTEWTLDEPVQPQYSLSHSLAEVPCSWEKRISLATISFNSLPQEMLRYCGNAIQNEYGFSYIDKGRVFHASDFLNALAPKCRDLELFLFTNNVENYALKVSDFLHDCGRQLSSVCFTMKGVKAKEVLQMIEAFFSNPKITNVIGEISANQTLVDVMFSHTTTELEDALENNRVCFQRDCRFIFLQWMASNNTAQRLGIAVIRDIFEMAANLHVRKAMKHSIFESLS